MNIRTDIPKELIPYSDKIIIGTITRIGAGKDFDTLFKAIEILNRQSIRFQLIIVGDGPDRKKYEKKARDMERDMKIENCITFFGFKSNPHRYLRYFDIVVLSTISEGVPNLILDAMVLGKPIVATDVGAISEAIENGKSGVLVSPRNPEMMADIIYRLMIYKGYRIYLGKNAQRDIKKFSKEKMWNDVERLFKEIK